MDDFENLPKMAGWHETKLTVPEGQILSFHNPKPNYTITFFNNTDISGAGTQVGRMDFNGPEMVFEGDAAESAKVFIDWVASAFKGRLDEEYQRGFNDAKEGKEPRP